MASIETLAVPSEGVHRRARPTSDALRRKRDHGGFPTICVSQVTRAGDAF